MQGNGPLGVTLLVIETLDVLRIPYLVTGSLASTAYGRVRTTLDADILADVKREHVAPLARRLESAFYVSREAIEEAVQYRRSFNVIHLATSFKVDIFVPKRPFDHVQLQRRIRHVLSDHPRVEMYVASPEDVVLAKLEWFRRGGEVSSRQWHDVIGVLKVQEDRLDMTYMRDWGARLGVLDLLERALAEASN